MKKALITGITGQDGTYLAEYLLTLGYEVYGLIRRDPRSVTGLQSVVGRVELQYGDLRDAASLDVAFHKAWPDEVYNLGGQVFVPASWDRPAETFDANVGGLLRILQIVERRKPDTRVYQASSSEIFGNVDGPCSETTPFHPTSPYGTSKMAAHRLCAVYRDRGLYVVGGILFNHESPRRGPEMVTRKITRAAAAWARGDRTKVRLGNLDARRDWGFAGDYVKAMHAMLQLGTPQDFVIGTGQSHSVREFLAAVIDELRDIAGSRLPWATPDEYVETDPALVRASEIRDLRADPSQAREVLGWKAETDFRTLVSMMVRGDVHGCAA
jgi:GDPmannose 4,6-dehydratase